MAALTAYEQGLLRSSAIRSCKTRFWLFDALNTNFSTYVADSNYWLRIANPLEYDGYNPTILVSPPYALVKPGQSVVVDATDSYDLIATVPITSFTWSLVSGSAILSPSGATCTITPTGGENTTATVRCTGTGAGVGVTATGSNYRDIHVACSTNGWGKPTGQVRIEGSYSAMGWSGSVEVAGDSAVGLAKGKLLLIHIDTTYDGVEYTMGGYRRANNLCLLAVKDWTYVDGPDGHQVCRISLFSPAQLLNSYSLTQENDSGDRQEFLLFLDASTLTTSFTRLAYVVDNTAMTPSLASNYIAWITPISKHFNVTIFEQSYVTSLLRLDAGGLYDQIASPLLSVLCIAMCDFAGSLLLIPHPAIRALDWWGTLEPLYPVTSPLTTESCNREVTFYPAYHESGRAWDGLVITGVNQYAEAIFARAGTFTPGSLINYDQSGYLLQGEPEEADWAQDYLDLMNRTWDVDVTMFCPGNALNVGSFAYLDLDPEQAGQPEVNGLAYCDAASHTIDIARQMQTSKFHFVQLTGSVA